MWWGDLRGDPTAKEECGGDAEMNVSGDPIRIRARLVQRLNLDSWGRPLHNTK